MLLKGWPDAAGLGLVLLPMLVGVGANGFSDTYYLAAGLGALLCLSRALAFREAVGQDRRTPLPIATSASVRREDPPSGELVVTLPVRTGKSTTRTVGRHLLWPLAALALLVLAASLSFRALVFAPVGVAAWWALRRTSNALAWGALAAALLALVPTVIAAGMVSPSLGQIPAHNPLHAVHLLAGKPRPWLFAALVAVSVALSLRRRALLTAGTAAACWVATLGDRSYGYWHALPLLVPWVVAGLATEAPAPRARWLALGLLLSALALAYLNPLEPTWLWLRRVTPAD
ncbi:MAG: hypothetical protein AMXMBFR34_07110 [Myxococcaceae bacterium]